MRELSIAEAIYLLRAAVVTAHLVASPLARVHCVANMRAARAIHALINLVFAELLGSG